MRSSEHYAKKIDFSSCSSLGPITSGSPWLIINFSFSKIHNFSLCVQIMSRVGCSQTSPPPTDCRSDQSWWIDCEIKICFLNYFLLLLLLFAKLYHFFFWPFASASIKTNVSMDVCFSFHTQPVGLWVVFKCLNVCLNVYVCPSISLSTNMCVCDCLFHGVRLNSIRMCYEYLEFGYTWLYFPCR